MRLLANENFPYDVVAALRESGQFPLHRAFQDELKRAVQGMERAFR